MPTEAAPAAARRPARARALAQAAACAAALALLAAAEARAQVDVNPHTVVHSIRVHYVGRHLIPPASLRAHMTVRAPGAFAWVRGLLSIIPFFPKPPANRLDPIELQRDVARMRRFYQQVGFPEASIRYQVKEDEKRNRVDITYFVREGPPLLVNEIHFRAMNDTVSRVLGAAPADSAAWTRFVSSHEPKDSTRVIAAQLLKLQGDVQDFWQSRGYPFVATSMTVDTAGPTHVVTVRTTPGPRATIDSIEVAGDTTLAENVVRRTLGLHKGELASSRALSRSEQQVRTLEAVRGAVVDVPQDQPHDTLVTVRARIRESDHHVVSGQAGYGNDAGISGEVRWILRNFAGGARTLTVIGAAQSGLLTPVSRPEIVDRLTVSLRQPAVFNPRTSLLVSPFAEFRNDFTGRSRKIGADVSLVHQIGTFQNVTFKYGISTQHIFAYQLGDFGIGRLDLLEAILENSAAVRESLGTDLLASTFTVSATLGKLDDPLYPRQGIAFRPSAQIATPTGLNAKEYARIEARVNAYAPLGLMTIATHVAAGRLYPYGKSLPRAGEDPFFSFVRLRDVLFFGGGAADARGWQDQLLGPKFPDIRNGAHGLFANGWTPVGGFNHESASVELQLPVPGFSTYLGWHVFLDGGRVWTTDSRYLAGQLVPGQQRFFYGTGAGIDVRTPAGPIRFSVGYKLNPSPVDLLYSGDYMRAILTGVPVESMPPHRYYRFAYHLSVGALF